ncbi:MAG: DUF2249 domain-containing protein [Sandaracinaceae bacterium]|nr:DUF2249 domain-containing protein [Sandaracinaceae bacterium]
MKLALSSEALPGSTPAELARACASRGLAGVELVLDVVPTAAQVEAWRAGAVPVVALHVETLALASAPELAAIAGKLEVPVAAPPGWSVRPRPRSWRERTPPRARRSCSGCGRGPKTSDRWRGSSSGSGRARWVSCGTFARSTTTSASPTSSGERAHLTSCTSVSRGGGPEQREQDGRGLGGLFVHLALAGYPGVVAMAPSEPARVDAWREWARTSSSSGCGSRAHSRPSHGDGQVGLDVRPIEPKDRIETVLGAYAGIGPGETLRLVMDHEPECIRHLLTATQPVGSFGFEYLERGPEVWKVDVVKREAD